MRLLKLQTIVVATDLTSTSNAALVTAARLAEAAGAKLHVAHAAPESDEIIAETGRRTEYVEEVTSAMHHAGVEGGGAALQIHIVTGSPPSAISMLADRMGADVIVLGRHREGAQLPSGRPMGSTAYAVVTNTVTPCLVTRRPLNLPLRRALVAIDCSESARGALLVALSWTSALRSPAKGAKEPTLMALHVETADDVAGSDPEMRRSIDHELDVLRRSAGGWAGVKVEGVTLPGTDAVSTIAKYATDHRAELVVLGTRGLGGGDGHVSELGSVSAAITRQLDVPVLLVPPAIWRNYAKDVDYF